MRFLIDALIACLEKIEGGDNAFLRIKTSVLNYFDRELDGLKNSDPIERRKIQLATLELIEKFIDEHLFSLMIYQDFQNFKNGHQIWLTYQIPEEKRDFTIIIEDPSAFEFMKSFEIPKIIDSVNLPNESIRLILATALGHL